MNKGKIAIFISLALALVVGLLLVGFASPSSPIIPAGTVLAGASDNGNNGNGNGVGPPPYPHGKVKPAERQAAADKRAADLQAAGLTLQAVTVGPGDTPDYFGITPNYANSPLPTVDPNTLVVTGGIQKFVDSLPQLNQANDLNQTLPVAVPETLTIGTAPEADYYEIAAIQTSIQMHGNLTPTPLRVYVQIETPTFAAAHPGVSSHVPLFYPGGSPILKNGQQVYAVRAPQYLGPIIIAQRDRPVRILFDNYLPPTSDPGYLFVPVDTSYLGAGPGFNNATGGPDNRAVIHLHGGVTPWVSDGTPQQWLTPGNEPTGYAQGPSTANVPDMPVPANGSVTLYYTNQQSARLMFYHDHALGLTRLNVYDGLAAGYLLQDPVEKAMVEGGTISPPGWTTPVQVTAGTIPATQIPLVIQDKTFVPDAAQLALEDPTWDSAKWGGGNGSLWFPHVYMPNQNPYDVSGANPMGRWDYGPWFWPPFTGLINGPLPNPYYGSTPYEPPFIPGVPNVSGTPEAFMDTPVVNGTVYPTLTVPAAPVRFRILNAANDRYWNLQLYQATAGIVSSITVDTIGGNYTAPVVTITGGGGGIGAAATATVNPTGNITGIDMISVGSGYTSVPTVNISDPTGTGATATAHIYNAAPTEVGMVPASLTAGINFPMAWREQTPGMTPDILDGRQGGVPDPALRGPAMVQIGTEGGFLPAPALLHNIPIGYEQNKRNITVMNVKQHTLLLGPAERADVIVDFTNFAGKTLILYNDAPAALPAGDPRNDYYTSDLDQTSTGGAPTTQPGYGPNTRTIMQIKVDGVDSGVPGPVDAYNDTNFKALQTALPAAFAASQDTIIVPQTPYQAAYPGTSMPDVGNASQYMKLQDTSFTFKPIGQNTALTMETQPKSVIEDFTVDYGRMDAILGVEIPHTNNTNQTSIIQGYIDPPTELIQVSDKATLIGALNDGTQIWKITHNGVDTHAVHVHLFNAQVVNRVGWDGAIYPPEPNEIGWKETIQMNPLEDIIIALRPITMTLPWDLTNSVRLLDPSRPAGATGVQFANVDPNGNPVTVTNELVNFGWEYVWHCHLLGHEENDMMRPIAFGVPPLAPSNLTASKTGNGGGTKVTLKWTNNSKSATHFLIQRATLSGGPWADLITLPASTTTYTETIGTKTYWYQVFAVDNIGTTKASGFTAPVPGYSMLTMKSAPAGPVTTGPVPPPLAAPTNVNATYAVQGNPRNSTSVRITLTWTGVAGATGYNIEVATTNTFTAGSIVATGNPNGGATSWTSANLTRGVAYYVHIRAVKGTVTSDWANANPFPINTP